MGRQNYIFRKTILYLYVLLILLKPIIREILHSMVISEVLGISKYGFAMIAKWHMVHTT